MRLKRKQSNAFCSNSDSNLVVSLTSFPARINNVWVTIESIFQQDYKPWKIVLVLADSEFPERALPASIEQQVSRGLEIIWTDLNLKSYNKLLPVRKAYPDATIITVDDDIIYEPWRISRLLAAAEENPNTVVGHRGWEVCIGDGEFKPYASWPLADKATKKYRVLLTGVGGVLYPPGLLNEEMLFDINSLLELAPSADDVWFWAVAVSSGVKAYCLGYEKHFQISSGASENALSTLNVQGGRNDIQLRDVVEKYDLIKRMA